MDIITDLDTQREYIVTVKKGVNWRDVHADLTNDTSTDNSVDSNIIPDRSCECCKERPNNPRNTHYHLTETEARKLRQDPRIIDVLAVETIPEIQPRAFQEGQFNRTSSGFGTHDNWGLLRHVNETNVYLNDTIDPGGTYDYVLDGTGVDVVIIDTGIQVGHPEWEDANEVSRLKQVNWYSLSGILGTQPANFYTDTNGHGTHCIGTMAGKNFGWGKNADIYNFTLYGNANNIGWDDMIDIMTAWHTKKNNVDDAAYTGRPTVVNMSFGYVWYIDTSTSPNQIKLSSGGTGYDITGGRYRGVTHTDTTYSTLRQHGINGEYQGGTLYGFPRKIASNDADVEALINSGIHVCCAAGNDSMKCDVPGGLDYDNYLTFTSSGQTYYMYYHRGGTPSTVEGGSVFLGPSVSPPEDEPAGDINEGFYVGAVDNTATLSGSNYVDNKTSFSQSGPMVNIYAVGKYVISAQPNGMGQTYSYDSSWRQAKYSGTSMAAPQMVGMIACLLQAHPDWTPGQVKSYFENNAVANMRNTGVNNDYQVSSTIHGGPNRIAYFPMNGQRPFSQTSSEVV